LGFPALDQEPQSASSQAQSRRGLGQLIAPKDASRRRGLPK
jgi:hypothetical protein